MFDFAWSEIALIGAVALIAIGPKDMPAAIRTVSSMIKKARRMAAEFQTHVEEMVREAELGDVKKAFNDIRNFDVGGVMERTIDPDRSLRKTFEDNPFEQSHPTSAEVSTLDEVAVGTQPAEPAILPEPEESPPAEPARMDAPAYIPPQLVPPAPAEPAVVPTEAPAWIPPELVLQRRPKA